MKFPKKLVTLISVLSLGFFLLNTVQAILVSSDDVNLDPLSDPKIVMGPDGAALITWLEKSGDNLTPRSKTLTLDQEGYVPADILSIDKDSIRYELKQAVDLVGNIVCFWKENDGGNTVIKSSYLPANTSDWEDPVVVVNSRNPISLLEVSIALSGKGIVAWSEDTEDAKVIKTRAFNKNVFAPAIDFIPSDNIANLKFAVAPKGDTVAVWENIIENEKIIMSARWKFNTDEWTPFAEPIFPSNASSPQIVMSAWGDATVVCVIENTGIQASKLSSESDTWSHHLLEEQDFTLSDLQLVTDFSEKSTVLWKAADEKGIFIQSAVFSPKGDWSPIENVSDINVNVSDPQIVADSFGNIAAAWRNIVSNDSIIVQFAKLSSAGIWSDPINLSKENEKAGIPQIDTDNVGNAVVIWPSETLNVIQAITIPSPDPRDEEMRRNSPSSTDSPIGALLANPVIDQIIPFHGPYAGNTPITVFGSGFIGVNIVGFGNYDVPACPTGVPYCFTIVSDTEITLHSFPATAGCQIAGIGVCYTNTECSSAFLFYYDRVPPTVTGLSPSSGPPAGGTVVTISGSNFTGGVSTPVFTVTFGGVPGTNLVFIDDSTIQITSPAGSPCDEVDVQVTTQCTGTSATSPASKFTYSVGVAAPVITGISPNTGPPAGGTSVTLTGSGFTNAEFVLFGPYPATTYTVVSDTQIDVISPAAPTCTNVYITVGTCAGQSAPVNPNAQFVYSVGVTDPVITGISPSVGSPLGGTPVTITGINLTGVVLIDFGGIPLLPCPIGAPQCFTVNSDTSITVTSSPPGSPCTTVEVRAGNCAGLSAINPPATLFTFNTLSPAPPPVVSSLTPAAGNAGTSVTINGSGFTGVTFVYFAGTSVPFTFNSDLSISVTAPAGLSCTVDVRVITCGGTSAISAGDQFTYSVGTAPTITNINPATGPAGQIVTITGTNFNGAVTPNGVMFGMTPAPILSNTGTQITVNVPTIAGATNCESFDVTVTTCVGTSNAVPFAYQTQVAPTITTIAPTTGPAGTLVTITGTNFTGAAIPNGVMFGTTSAPILTITDTQITVNVPTIAGATNCESFDVTVTTCVGTSNALPFIYQTQSAPTITSIAPTTGTVGTLVTITGTNFTGAEIPTGVMFGTTPAPILTITDTQITVNVPTIAGATNCESFDVTVTTCVGTSNAVPFAYQTQGAPTITTIAPTTGPAGTLVTITGTNFTGAAIPNGVMFGTTSAPILTITDTQITVNVPTIAGATNCESFDVTVTTCVGTSNAVPFAYQTQGAPTMTTIAPTTGPAGTLVTITGTNFTGAEIPTGVMFGTTPAPILTITDTQITVNVPTIAGATNCESFDVTVTTCVGTSNAVPFQYQTQSAPTITTIAPITGTAGTLVTITGTNFTGAEIPTGVMFGTTPAPILTITDTQITVNVPTIAGATNCESFDVTVTTCVGTSNAVPFQYQTQVAPTITSIAPTTGPAGTLVTITGTNFTGAAIPNGVMFGMTPAPILTITDTQITVNVPTIAGATNCESFDVTVTTCVGTSNAVPFIYQTQSAPTITTIAPTTGTAGTLVTITGTNFTGAEIPTGVMFGTTPAPILTITDTQITVNVPTIAGATNCESFDVTVTTCVGTSNALPFAYQTQGAPTVAGLSSNSGPQGQAVTITGTNFTGVSSVHFGTTSVAFTFVDDSTINATSGIASDCVVNVTVTTCVGTSAASPANQFTYTDLPNIISLNPNFGPSTGLNPVNIVGTGFLGTLGTVFVNFGSIPATVVTVSPTLISVLAPPAPFQVCQLNVTVTTCNGVSNGVPYFYVYPAPLNLIDPPIITSITPDNGAPIGGNTVLIQGTDLTNVSGVMFGSVPSPLVTPIDSTSLNAVVPPSDNSSCVVDVIVMTCDRGNSNSFPYTYNFLAPTITGLSQNSGSPSGGNTITITGTDFVGITAVQFGTQNALNFTRLSPTSISAVVPPGLACDVQVRVTGCAGISPTTPLAQYTYNFGVPTITSVVPNTGPTAGGNSVVITGTNFAVGASVLFGANPAATVTVNSTTQITAIAPPGALGTVDIRVTSCGQTSAIVAADRYTYQDAPNPPSNFIGCIKKNKFLNGTKCVLQATWTASTSANAAAYRIYKDNTIVATIPATSPLVFSENLPNCTATGYSITAVSASNQESAHVALVIVSG